MELDKAALDRWITREDVDEIELDGLDYPDLFVDKLLTDDERAKILAAFRDSNLDGAHVRDILTIMYDSDACLRIVEPMAAANHLQWTPIHHYAVLLLALLHPEREIVWQDVIEFLSRALDEIEVEEEPVEETVDFYDAGTLGSVAHYHGDPITPHGVAVVACSKCCALIGDDDEHANRGQHARVAHGLGATR